MDAEAAILIAASLKLIAGALAIGLATLGPGIGIGIVASGALNSMARNPDVSGQIVTNMFIGIAFAEALAIFQLGRLRRPAIGRDPERLQDPSPLSRRPI